jgi:hypothetical protein
MHYLKLSNVVKVVKEDVPFNNATKITLEITYVSALMPFTLLCFIWITMFNILHHIYAHIKFLVPVDILV